MIICGMFWDIFGWIILKNYGWIKWMLFNLDFSTAAQLDISSCRSGNGWECAVGYVGEVLHTCSTDVMALVFTKWWKMEMENWWNWKNNTGLQNRDIPYVDLLEPNPYVWITEITVEVADCCWLRSIAQFWNVETVWQEWPSHPMNITFLSHHHPIIIWFSPSITMYRSFSQLQTSIWCWNFLQLLYGKHPPTACNRSDRATDLWGELQYAGPAQWMWRTTALRGATVEEILCCWKEMMMMMMSHIIVHSSTLEI